MVIDAKYRELYQQSGSAGFDIKDIRQVSGYARLESVYKSLDKDENESIECLIIYPDQTCQKTTLIGVDLMETEVGTFAKFYKVAIELPKISV